MAAYSRVIPPSPSPPPLEPVNMEDFTPPAPPPPPNQTPPAAAPAPSAPRSAVPPPLPPPPRDLPEGYRASNEYRRPQAADIMPGIHPSASVRRSSRDSKNSPPTSPAPERTRRGSFNFLSRSKSRSRETSTVTSSNGSTMLRKQKLRDHEERLRQVREEKPPAITSPAPPPAPVTKLHTTTSAASADDAVSESSSSATLSTNNKASNFSRPSYQAPNIMPTSTSLPVLTNAAQRYQRPSDVKDKAAAAMNGEYVGPHARGESIDGRHYSQASSSLGNINSPRRIRRRKDPTSFK